MATIHERYNELKKLMAEFKELEEKFFEDIEMTFFMNGREYGEKRDGQLFSKWSHYGEFSAKEALDNFRHEFSYRNINFNSAADKDLELKFYDCRDLCEESFYVSWDFFEEDEESRRDRHVAAEAIRQKALAAEVERREREEMRQLDSRTANHKRQLRDLELALRDLELAQREETRRLNSLKEKYSNV